MAEMWRWLQRRSSCCHRQTGMASTNCLARTYLTVNQLIDLPNLSPGSCEICMKIFQSVDWHEKPACPPAILIGLSKAFLAAHQQNLWRYCASTRQSGVSQFLNER